MNLELKRGIWTRNTNLGIQFGKYDLEVRSGSEIWKLDRKHNRKSEVVEGIDHRKSKVVEGIDHRKMEVDPEVRSGNSIRSK